MEQAPSPCLVTRPCTHFTRCSVDAASSTTASYIVSYYIWYWYILKCEYSPWRIFFSTCTMLLYNNWEEYFCYILSMTKLYFSHFNAETSRYYGFLLFKFFPFLISFLLIIEWDLIPFLISDIFKFFCSLSPYSKYVDQKNARNQTGNRAMWTTLLFTFGNVIT